MTASELVEQLQIIIKNVGDFNVVYVDRGETQYTWFCPVEHIKFCNSKKLIELR